ncbi:hypothetical protein ICU98_02100 [Polynucleobacter sp. MWH-P3-07-1]|uniref:hypothetical protein n=1 Tax=Polynucleobacter sp. MWH-P3-07-1 TaxID=1743173 RepID=UPI001BFE0E47|nr:hypothetical protein [Polynucleobacter sp. MWH-P3-07-1]QWD84454.1 hypothetical protein ICU98_02100 [Polynucleobacter sp. MWH-P3-07-1]
MSNTDKRCCGSGVCIINQQGECWCGQAWNGSKMAPPSFIPPGINAENSEVTLSKQDELKPKE